ncbi:hypothetical protein [Pseudoclavibacter soli]|uniref:hypothetical protein n=1 Tax=Pseudoclavibacter soli TaxID=452623 RepID=UPI00041701E6|nr:hypothetical protein [Pseudoclavibacter soli]
MSEPVYQFFPFILEEGEQLILPGGSAALVKHWDDFTEQTGISRDATAESPMLALPLPVSGGILSEDLVIDALWLPWLWRPERLATRLDGETPDHWLLRNALETTLNGLYQPEQGEWLDALAVVGLDSEEAATYERAARHLLGEPDELLTSLPDLLYPQANASVAADLADQLEPIYPAVAWHLAADDILELLASVQANADSTRDLVSAAEWVIAVSQRVFADLPTLEAGKPTSLAVLEAVLRTSVPTWPKYQLAQVAAAGGPWAFFVHVFEEIRDTTQPAADIYTHLIDQSMPGTAAQPALEAE